MKRISLIAFALLSSGGLAATVRADFDFTFASTPTITAASANPPGTTNTITNGITIGGLPASTFSCVAPSGTSTIALTGRNTSASLDATGGVTPQFLDVTVTSNDTATRAFSVNFDTTFTLTDPTPNAGPGPQLTHFVGKLTGSIGSGTTTMAFSLPDFNPAIGAGPTLTAGDGTFLVTLFSSSDPGLGAGAQGHLTARISQTPEPATAALALATSAMAIRRRRRA